MEKYSLEWALQESRKVYGFLRIGEEQLLYKFALEKPKGTHVYEIGSFYGRSTILLASACKFSEDGLVFAIDPHKKPDNYDIKPEYDLWAEQKISNTYDKFCDNITKADVDDFVQPVRATSEEVGKAMIKTSDHSWNKIGFLFIDGCHQRNFVEMDFDLFYPWVVSGGIIAMHDANEENNDFSNGAAIVAKQRITDSDKFSEIGKFKSIVWGRKK